MKDEDFMFEVSVRAVEKTTMRHVFSEQHYSVHDGDILWDREFEDQIYADEDGNSVYDYTLLDNVRTSDNIIYSWRPSLETSLQMEASTANRVNLKFCKCMLWLIFFFSRLGRATTGFKSPPRT